MLIWIISLHFSAMVARAAETTSIAVMTQNLRCLPEQKTQEAILKLEERVQRLLNIVAIKRVDVLALQEVCSDIRSPWRQTSALELILTESRRRGLTWQRPLITFTHHSYERYREDLVILSRHPYQKEFVSSLPDPLLGRAVQAIYFADRDLWLANTHLSHADDGGLVRRRQIKQITSYFKHDRAIIVGDFNSAPKDRESAEFFISQFRPSFPSPTYPAHAPKYQYDGAWTRGSTASAHLPLDIGSDHLGVILTVQP